jgi:hypothetical protein
MVYYKLKIINKLNTKEEKKKQIKLNYTATKAAAMLSNTLVLFITKTNPFTRLNILLLLFKV